jgi:transposase
LARLDPKLLYLIRHRGEGSQAHMALIRSRQALIGCRTQLVNHVRGVVKSFGHRLPKCLVRNFHKRAPEHIPKALVPALGPILEQIGSLSERIGEYDWRLVAISEDHCPETALLRQVEGIGPLTALTFVLTREDPYRFDKSRSVGAYLGLVPATDRSGDSAPQKCIWRRRAQPPDRRGELRRGVGDRGPHQPSRRAALGPDPHAGAPRLDSRKRRFFWSGGSLQ